MLPARLLVVFAVGTVLAGACARATAPARAQDGAAATSPRAAPVDPTVPSNTPGADRTEDSEVARPPGPRCSATEATCLPIPYDGDPQLRGGERQTRYDPRARRHAVKGWTSTENADRCHHDGDCVRGGCGNSCVGWNHDVGVGVCLAYGELHEAYCGCVAGFCGWFTQLRGSRPAPR